MKQYDATKKARSTKRSDGTVKVYGFTQDGKLMTVVMTPKEFQNEGYDIAEIKVAGKITLSRL